MRRKKEGVLRPGRLGGILCDQRIHPADILSRQLGKRHSKRELWDLPNVGNCMTKMCLLGCLQLPGF